MAKTVGLIGREAFRKSVKMFNNGTGDSSNLRLHKNSSDLRIREESIFFQIFSGFLGSFAVLGNLTAILAIISQSHKITRAYKLIANLALSDCFTGCVILLFTVILTDKSLVQNNFLCSLVYSLLLFSTSASVNSLLLVTIDRYLIIVWPLRYEQITSFAKGEFIAAVGWTLAFLFAFFPVSNIFGRKQLTDTCSLGNIFTKEYILFMFSVTYLIPLTIMMILYMTIAMIARKHRKQISSLQVAGPMVNQEENEETTNRTQNVNRSRATVDSNSLIRQKARSKEQWKATKTIFIVLGYFIFSWLPFYICMLLTSTIKLSEE